MLFPCQKRGGPITWPATMPPRTFTGSGRLSAFNMDPMHPHPSEVTHAPYRREPYIRVQLDNNHTVDAKAAAWTRTHVLAHWADDDGKMWDKWVPATDVRRISRGESAWQDPYDIEQ